MPTRETSRSFRHSLRDFWQRVTEGMELHELWTQFKSEARASYGLYSREVDWEAVGRGRRWMRPFRVGRALFWAMLMKLSPARRVIFLLAAVLFLISGKGIGFRVGGTRIDFGTGAYVSISVALLFLLLVLELSDRVTMKRDLEIAREIQQWLVPERPPNVPGVELAFATRPANTVAGDYYDAIVRDALPEGGRLLVVVADVAGKSVPAALLMATFQASLRALAALPGSLGELVAGLNRYACAHSLDGRRYTTALLAELVPETRALTYVNAGHNAAVLRHASGAIERLETGGLPLGIEAGAVYQLGQAALAAGDLLVIFTDGVIEAVNEAGEEFGETRLLEVLQKPPGNAEQMLRAVMAAVDAFVGAARRHDDITCLVLRAV